MERTKLNRWWIAFVLIVPLTTLYVWNTTGTDVEGLVFQGPEFVDKEKYLVNSSMCRIPDVGAWNHDTLQFYEKKYYVPCSTKKPLTYTTNNGTTALLSIDRDVEPQYCTRGITCCVSYIQRIDDKHINYTNCEYFEDSVVLRENTILVKCYNRKNLQQVYSNAHVVARLDDELRIRAEALKRKLDPPSILMVGIDSMSRSNMLRSMPKTVGFLEKNDWISLKGYNKIDDNTFPNLMGILTGRNFSNIEKMCNPYQPNSLDKCDYVWKDYKSFGYVTAYAEDETWLNTFNYLKPGFKNPPTDLYYYPYMLAAEHISKTELDHMSYCAGNENSAERIFNAAKDFAVALKDFPKFGFFWTSTGSHNRINSAARMDDFTLQFFEDIHSEKVLENTIVIFFSDHGLRFGNILLTRSGWLEERLPFIYFYIPDKFRKKYPSEYLNLKGNAERLTSPYDFHMTLKDTLVLSGLEYSVTQSAACPKCKSLFKKAEEERPCEDAGITIHWCTCLGYREINGNDPLIYKGVEYIIDRLNRDLASDEILSARCTELKFNKIISSSISENMFSNNTYLLIMFSTIPETILQATLLVEYEIDEPKFSFQGSISRLDFYKFTSECVDSWKLKMYCYCKFNIFLDMNFFTFWFEV